MYQRMMRSVSVLLLLFHLLSCAQAADVAERVNVLNTSSQERGVAQSADPLWMIFGSERLSGSGGNDLYLARRKSENDAWEFPTSIRELNTRMTEFEPSLRQDGLELFFTSDRLGNGYRVFHSVRTTTESQWGAPAMVAEISTTPDTAGPMLSTDGLTIYYHASRPGGKGSYDIYRATRPDWNSPFGPSVEEERINTDQGEWQPYLAADGLVMFFSSIRPGGLGDMDTWYATRSSQDSPWGGAVNYAAANSAQRDYDPFLSFDGKEFYADSERLGQSDLWLIRNPGVHAFPLNVSSVNAGTDDQSPFLSPDFLSMLFASNRPGGPGGEDLYETSRPLRSSQWHQPSPITELNSYADEMEPCLRSDGLEIFFASSRQNGFDIWKSERRTSDTKWRAPQRVNEISSNGDDLAPSLSPDGLALLFQSVRDDTSGKPHVYTATRPTVTEPFSKPVLVSAIRSDAGEQTPSLAPDGLSLLFSSSRPGTSGDLDLWCSIRPRMDRPWVEPVHFGSMNSEKRDAHPFVTSDAKELFFDSDRPGSCGARDIWVLRNPPIDIAR